jgi:hypothetical protein
MKEPAFTSRYARERAAVDVPGAARDGERAVDGARGRLVDKRLGGLGLGEQCTELLSVIAKASRERASRLPLATIAVRRDTAGHRYYEI